MMRWWLYLRSLLDPATPPELQIFRAGGPIAFVWANGTDAEIEDYKRLLEFFQAAGVTVVACKTGQAWDGVDVAKAAAHARRMYGITTVVGFGHSGGGGGVLRAAGLNASLFDRIVVLATGRHVDQLPRCPAFFAVGDADAVIDRDAFLAMAVSYPGPKVVASHATASHNSITAAAGPYALRFGIGGLADSEFLKIHTNAYWTIH